MEPEPTDAVAGGTWRFHRPLALGCDLGTRLLGVGDTGDRKGFQRVWGHKWIMYKTATNLQNANYPLLTFATSLSRSVARLRTDMEIPPKIARNLECRAGIVPSNQSRAGLPGSLCAQLLV